MMFLEKKYVYKVYLGEFINPFKRFYTAHWRFPVNLDSINVALQDLIGEHDFTSFVASGSTAKSNIRTIYNATCKYDKVENELEFEFYGNGFLYNMVRIMVGVLLEIGSKYRDEHDILRLYKVKNRDQARRTAAACGLYLKKRFIIKGRIRSIQLNYHIVKVILWLTLLTFICIMVTGIVCPTISPGNLYWCRTNTETWRNLKCVQHIWQNQVKLKANGSLLMRLT